MKKPKLLVAGIGNIFFGDDAFGVEVVHRLVQRPLPAEVQVVDFGIRGYDLVFSLLDGFEGVILVDVTQRGNPPGTLYVLELDPASFCAPQEREVDGHGMQPDRVLSMATALGAKCQWVRLVACEPAELSLDEEKGSGLSEPVTHSLEEACQTVLTLIDQFLQREVHHA